MLIDSTFQPLANGETFTVLKIEEAHLIIFQYQGHPCYSECSCLCSVSFLGESWQRSSTIHVPIYLEWIEPFAQKNFHGQAQNAMFTLGSPRVAESHAWRSSHSIGHHLPAWSQNCGLADRQGIVSDNKVRLVIQVWFIWQRWVQQCLDQMTEVNVAVSGWQR